MYKTRMIRLAALLTGKIFRWKCSRTEFVKPANRNGMPLSICRQQWLDYKLYFGYNFSATKFK
jgi:hypothetical protein